MTLLSEIIDHNRSFVENKEYEQYLTGKFPDKRMVVITCMDTRLTELLPKALNLRNGDAKILKSAGAVISHPFGSAMRSILVAVLELKADEVLVVGHHGCGMTGLDPQSVLEKAKQRGVAEDTVELLTHAGINLNSWLSGFENVEESVLQSVNMVRNHPLMPNNVPVHGLVIHPETGKLDLISDGYAAIAAKE
jgi:carbonic anhydrase